MSCTWQSNYLLNSITILKETIMLCSEATVKTAVQELSWKSTVRRKGKEGKRNLGRIYDESVLWNSSWTCWKEFLLLFWIFHPLSAALSLLYLNLRIKNYILFCCFSYCFKHVLLIFTQRLVIPAFIYIPFPVI